MLSRGSYPALSVISHCQLTVCLYLGLGYQYPQHSFDPLGSVSVRSTPRRRNVGVDCSLVVLQMGILRFPLYRGESVDTKIRNSLLWYPRW